MMKSFMGFLSEQHLEITFLIAAGILSTAVQVETHKFLAGWFGIILVKALIVIMLWRLISLIYYFVCGRK